MNAAAKYEELQGQGLERPRCDCHHEPQTWNRDTRQEAGGYWRCAVKDRVRQPDKRREAYDRWLAKHPEDKREHRRRWRVANPDKARVYDATRRARKAAAFVEVVDLQKVYDRDDGTCYLCGSYVALEDCHLEHIRPLARDGQHKYANVAISCDVCNQRKGAKTVAELDPDRRQFVVVKLVDVTADDHVLYLAKVVTASAIES